MTRRALLGFFLLAAVLALAPRARAQEVESQWSFAAESDQPEEPGAVQARASIYRGDHLLALRCHKTADRRWETLLFSATWFLHPKSNPVFALWVDEGAPIELQFQRLTDFRFALTSPPAGLLAQLIAGKELHVGGPDFQGNGVVIPLDGSGEAITGAFQLCGYAMPAVN